VQLVCLARAIPQLHLPPPLHRTYTQAEAGQEAADMPADIDEHDAPIRLHRDPSAWQRVPFSNSARDSTGEGQSRRKG
jgi:hypothetical protein